jgi:hypothetical protein
MMVNEDNLVEANQDLGVLAEDVTDRAAGLPECHGYFIAPGGSCPSCGRSFAPCSGDCGCAK